MLAMRRSLVKYEMQYIRAWEIEASWEFLGQGRWSSYRFRVCGDCGGCSRATHGHSAPFAGSLGVKRAEGWIRKIGPAVPQEAAHSNCRSRLPPSTPRFRRKCFRNSYKSVFVN